MKTVEDLIYQLKHQDYGNNSPNVELAIEKVARNRQFFTGLLNRKDGWEAITRDIYEWLVAKHDNMQRATKIVWRSANTNPPWKGEELPVRFAPLHDDVKKSWMEQAAFIGAAIAHAIESVCNEPEQPVPPKRQPRSLTRQLLLGIIHPMLKQNKSYTEILDALDDSDRELLKDPLFKKWIQEHKIQCWIDIKTNPILTARFQKFLSEEKKRLLQR
jgi:hypothetical protein